MLIISDLLRSATGLGRSSLMFANLGWSTAMFEEVQQHCCECRGRLLDCAPPCSGHKTNISSLVGLASLQPVGLSETDLRITWPNTISSERFEETNFQDL